MQLPAPDPHVAAIEDRERQRVLKQARRRKPPVITVDADDAHEVGDDPNGRLGAEYFGLNRKFGAAGDCWSSA